MTANTLKLRLQQWSRAGQIALGAAVDVEVALEQVPALRITQIVRRVADRRLVCRGVWNGVPVFAKLFLGTSASKYASRDLRGVRALTDAGLLTPPLLHAGPLAETAGEALVFAAIDVAGHVEDALRGLSDDSAGRLALIRLLTQTVALHHAAGLLQTDLYLKNFLVRDAQVYTLDGDGIRKLGGLFQGRCALSNLAQLFSKMDVTDDVWIPQLYETYCLKRGLSLKSDELSFVIKKAFNIRRKVTAGYADKKVFRTCTDVQVERSFNRYSAVSRPWVNAIAAITEPDQLLGGNEHKRLKSGNTCTVSLAQIGERKMVVKRYNIKNFWHGLGRALRPTRAAKSWASAHRLIMYGIATAAPIALLEKRLGIVRRQAYFLAEFIDAPDVAEFFTDAKVGATQKQAVADNIACLFYKLYLLKLDHGDFKSTNMKIVDGRPVLIDLDSLREHRCGWTFGRRHVRDLRRFMRNWQHDEAMRDIIGNALKTVYKDTGLLHKAGIR